MPTENSPRFRHYITRPWEAFGPVSFSLIVGGALLYDFFNRNEGRFTPETGWGYWFGIIGGSMMLILLLYPLRKRARGLKFLGKIPSWFKWHMILGVVGPALVMIHSNWKLESMNATVATIAMLIVVASGVIGRYLYARVHMGLYGHQTGVRQIMDDASLLKNALGEDVAQTGELLEELRAFEAKVLTPGRGFIAQVWLYLTFGFRKGAVQRRMMRLAKDTIAAEGDARGWSWGQRRKRREMVRQHLRLYFATLGKAVGFSVFERLFALWHVLHMPLFFLLVIAAIIHVVAVHIYMTPTTIGGSGW